jgi:hypothetical protein
MLQIQNIVRSWKFQLEIRTEKMKKNAQKYVIIMQCNEVRVAL